MDDLLELETRALLDLLARRGRGPAVGSAAALVAAIAAALVAKAAKTSTASWDGAGAAAEQAETLRARAAPLAQEDADAYAAAIARGDVDATAAAPLEISAVAAEVAGLAATVAERGNPALRPDATGAALLAEAAARVAASLVSSNLAAGADDPRVREAAGHVEAAGEAAARALAAA